MEIKQKSQNIEKWTKTELWTRENKVFGTVHRGIMPIPSGNSGIRPMKSGNLGILPVSYNKPGGFVMPEI